MKGSSSNNKLEIDDLKALRAQAIEVLEQLVTDEGIFASTNEGWQGLYHSWFGRDSAITANLILSAEENREGQFSDRAYNGLRQLARWQGSENNAAVGEEQGKIPHEVIPRDHDNVHESRRPDLSLNMWHHMPHDGALVNWDSVDSTPLWIITIIRWHEMSNKPYDAELLGHINAALNWCLDNLQKFEGWAGFLGASLQPERTLKGLHNQSWKDNYGTYQYPDKSLAEHPIKDVFVNGLFWSALQKGADVIESQDGELASQLRSTAPDLKKRFNEPGGGFLFQDEETDLHYFAEALDGKNQQLQAIAIDAALCLWAHYDGESIIDDSYVSDVIERILKPDMLNPEAGIRNYSNQVTARTYDNGYHRGPDTYWPFVSGLITKGLDSRNRHDEATAVARAMLHGVSRFDSCIELFLKNSKGEYVPWHQAKGQQQSARNQAWTAAAVYFTTGYLLDQAKI